MKYAVIYTSETGNTEELAKNVFVSLPGNDKKIINAAEMTELPEAECYFIGFPIKNRTCGIEILDILEQLDNVKIALFATCGMPASEKYKQYVENAVTLWINDGCSCLGFFLCQGKVSEKFREKLETETNYSQEELDRIIEIASAHPDDNDIDRLYEFVDAVTENLQ